MVKISNLFGKDKKKKKKTGGWGKVADVRGKMDLYGRVGATTGDVLSDFCKTLSTSQCW